MDETIGGKLMSDVPNAIGNTQSQAVFLLENRDFLREYPELGSLETKIFIRALDQPSEEEFEGIRKLPENSAPVVEFEDKLSSKVVVFYLGRIAADDFGEIVVLAGNGYGFGAHKVVRGMFERVVTAMYVARKPAEARVFAEQSAIDKYKLWERTVTAFPAMAKGVSEEDLRALRESSDAARKRLKTSVCPKCKQTLPDGPWTRKGIDAMAREVDDSLYRLYGQFYLEGTAQSHANSLGMERRLKPSDSGGWTYKETSEDEGRFALNLGHILLLKMLRLQNEFFGLGLDSEVEKREGAYRSIWKPDTTASSA